ncbi:MAG: hypothetical protein AAGA77_03850 [Bacteroidota bacterium]
MKLTYGLVLLVFLGCSTSKNTKSIQEELKPFEGVVTYKLSTPKPDMISEEEWNAKMKEVTGEQGYILQKNYYKSGQFAANINSGLEVGKQIYNSEDSLHYAWQLESDTVMVQDYRKESFVKVKEIIELDTTAMINAIECKAIKVNMNISQLIVWYNPDIIYIEEDTYKGTLYGSKVINKIKTLPIKTEIPGLLIIEMLDFQMQKLDESVFNIPDFKVREEMPTF